MDILGAIFSVFLILATNFIFIRKINRTSNNHYKYKIFFFLISITSISTILITAALFQSLILEDYFKITIDIIESYEYRIILIIILIIINITANYTLLKLYIQRVKRKNKNKINEIELIGKE